MSLSGAIALGSCRGASAVAMAFCRAVVGGFLFEENPMARKLPDYHYIGLQSLCKGGWWWTYHVYEHKVTGERLEIASED
jgi:hypothetical protein